MSTILEALQKQSNGYSGHSQKKEGLTLWKSALIAALVVIISLLSSLLYMQFANSEQRIDTQLSGTLNLPEKEQLNNNPIVISENPNNIETVISKPVKRITFVTQPLPEYEVQPSVLEVSSDSYLQPHQVVVPAEPEEQVVEPIVVDNKDIDYSDVSSELKQRFQRALEKGQEQGQKPIVMAMSSSSDIHQMSVEFQKQVPTIRYDSHMYSTLAVDRRIRINGEMLKEGQFDSRGEIELVEVLPNQSVFRFGMQSFTLESLMDWQGY
jgi:general secretion pathway protein B